VLIDAHSLIYRAFFALGDPVYNLTARDQVIGWDIAQRNERLYNVLDAFILSLIHI